VSGTAITVGKGLCQMRGISAIPATPSPGRALIVPINGALLLAAGALDGGGSRYLSYDAPSLLLIFATLITVLGRVIIAFPGCHAE
jgi:hypothetical protein